MYLVQKILNMKKSTTLFLLLPLLLSLFVKDSLNAQCNPIPCTTPSPSVNAADACVLMDPSALDCYFGSTTYTVPVSFPPAWCTTIENNHFFAFYADAPNAVFEICTNGCSSGSGVQAAILSTVDCIDFQFESACLGNIPIGGCQSLMATGLIPGEIYYLMIDGIAGAICDYSINAGLQNFYGPTGICQPNSNMAMYTATSLSSWSVNPPSAGIIQGNPVGTSVNILWVEQGQAQVCAMSFTCPDAPTQCLNVSVGEDVHSTDTVKLCQNSTVECGGQTYSNPGNYTVFLPSFSGCDSIVNCIVQILPPINTTQSVQLCLGGSVFCGGEEFFSSGHYTVTLPAFQGCDSTVHCLVNIVPPSVVDLDTVYVCQGSCFQVGDSSYCNSGSYTQILNNSLGCDSTILFDLVVLSVDAAAAIQAPQGLTITCTQPSLQLLSPNTPNVSHIWKNIGGDTLSTGNSIVVNAQGNYFHEVKASVSGTACSAQVKILIKQNNTPPPVTAMGGTLDATHPTVQLKGNTIISGCTYLWTGPNGFTSTLQKPIVSVPGIYTLKVTNPQTGCSTTVMVEVTSMS